MESCNKGPRPFKKKKRESIDLLAKAAGMNLFKEGQEKNKEHKNSRVCSINHHKRLWAYSVIWTGGPAYFPTCTKADNRMRHWKSIQMQWLFKKKIIPEKNSVISKSGNWTCSMGCF